MITFWNIPIQFHSQCEYGSMIVIVNIPPATSIIITVNIDNIGSHLVFSYLMLATENINIAVIPHIKDKREEMSWTIPDIDIPPELNEFLGCSSEYSSDENNTFNFMSIGP